MATPVEPFQYEGGPKVATVDPPGPLTAKLRDVDANAIADELTDHRQALADLAETVAAGPAANSITEAQLAPAVRTKLNAAGEGTAPAAGIDYASPVLVTAAATLQANKSHLVSGAGYALTLPDATANAGAKIFVQVAPDATGIYPVGDFSVYRSETLLLQSSGGLWKRVGGNWRPMSVEVRSDTSVALPNNATVSIPFGAPIIDNTGGLLTAGAANALTLRRDAVGQVFATLFTYAENGAIIEMGLSVGGNIYKVYATVAQGSGTATISKPVTAKAGDQVSLAVYTSSPTGAAQPGTTIAGGTSLSFTENLQ